MATKSFNVKDLVNAGVFSVLCILVTYVGGCIGFIPVLMPFVPMSCAFFGSIVFILYTTRIHRFGMVMILGIIFALVFSMSGHGIYIWIGALLCALISEWILKQGGYKSIRHARWACCAFMLCMMFNFLPLILSRDAYLQQLLDSGYGEEFVEQFSAVLPTWSMLPIAMGTVLGAYIGASLGIRFMKKHFKKANMV